MNDREPDRQTRARRLMMAALDGELAPGERDELDRLVGDDPALREEWARLQEVREVTATMGYREPPEEVWETYWVSVYNRVERGIGWVLISIGCLVMLGYALWHAVHALLEDTAVPPYLKIAIFAATLGGAILLFSVAREKWFTSRRDPYKEIQR